MHGIISRCGVQNIKIDENVKSAGKLFLKSRFQAFAAPGNDEAHLEAVFESLLQENVLTDVADFSIFRTHAR